MDACKGIAKELETFHLLCIQSD